MPHTPGPWQRGASLISNIAGYEIALVREPRKFARMGAAETMAEYEANADLITAAPDLLPQAKRLAWLCNELAQGNAFSADTLRRWGDEAQAVITKADG